MLSNEVPGDICVSSFTGRRNLVGFTPLLSMHRESHREREREREREQENVRMNVDAAGGLMRDSCDSGSNKVWFFGVCC
jgi:hypothetical protein